MTLSVICGELIMFEKPALLVNLCYGAIYQLSQFFESIKHKQQYRILISSQSC